MVLQSLIHKLQTPEQHDVDDMQKFLMEIGNPLLGAEVYTWGTVDAPECFEHDLITLCPRPKQDRFSRFLTENLTWMFRCVFRRKRKGTSDPNIAYYDTTVFKWTLALTGVLAPVLLIAPIIFLVLKVTSKTMRLWVVGIVNVVLGLCLTFFTEATRKDVFAVTAA